MTGRVNGNNEALIQVAVRGKGRLRLSISAIVDTGFSNYLTLPRKLIRALKLRRRGSSEAELADGTIVQFDVFAGKVQWDGQWREIEIDEAQSTPLIGMEMFKGGILTVEVWAGGAVNAQTSPTNSNP